MMKIYIGNDHRGVKLKKNIVSWLEENGYEVVNFGVDESDPVDYPDQARLVGEAVAADEDAIGILICGSGVGVQMAANKIPGVRAAQVWDEWIAEYARRHNNANVITFSNERQTHDGVRSLVEIFLNARFEGGRHSGRVAKIRELEQKR